MKIVTTFALGIKGRLSRFLESHDTKEDEDDTKEDEAALTIQSLEKNTVTDAGFCSNKESGKLN